MERRSEVACVVEVLIVCVNVCMYVDDDDETDSS